MFIVSKPIELIIWWWKFGLKKDLLVKIILCQWKKSQRFFVKLLLTLPKKSRATKLSKFSPSQSACSFNIAKAKKYVTIFHVIRSISISRMVYPESLICNGCYKAQECIWKTAEESLSHNSHLSFIDRYFFQSENPSFVACRRGVGKSILAVMSSSRSGVVTQFDLCPLFVVHTLIFSLKH